MDKENQIIITIINQYLQQLNIAGLRHVLGFIRGLTENGKGV